MADHVTSIYRDYGGAYVWVCLCGAEGRKCGDRADVEHLAYLHRKRMSHR